VWQLQDTHFVVAHLHYVLFGGSVFGLFAGLYYWFPKMSGRMLSESLGKASFWTMFVGFNLTFLVQHSMGLSGMPRRIYTYSQTLHVTVFNEISTFGSFILGIGVLITVVNVLISIKHGKRAGNDPWRANTLEWFVSSPGCGPGGSGFHGWPFCNGDVVPGLNLNSVIEYTHRALAGTVTIMMFSLAVLAFRRHRAQRVDEFVQCYVRTQRIARQ